MSIFYRALFRSTGEILECETLKAVYRFAMRNARTLIDDDKPVITYELEKVVYSGDYFINQYGYLQQEIDSYDHIAWVAVSASGYTVECDSGIYDIDRPGWKSKQKEVEV